MKTKLLEEIRAPKTKKELANIIKAQRISELVLRYIVAELYTGITELEAANLIKKAFIRYGTHVLSFSPIVAFGKNSANIHHEPNKTKLKRGDTVMFDIGCAVAHYCSDMTRTYFWGEPGKKQKKVYMDVLKAQEFAVKKLESGERRARVIDSTARKFLAKKYKNNFKHGLGHGVGTVIHEWPNFKPNSPDIIPSGSVMTVEPGIYIKGFGGVRIEDMYLITKKGVLCLTKPPKSLKDAILKLQK
jgi:Xaa-Pro aminopeptidase